METVTEPGFPRGGVYNLREGTPIYYLVELEKVHEHEGI